MNRIVCDASAPKKDLYIKILCDEKKEEYEKNHQYKEA